MNKNKQHQIVVGSQVFFTYQKEPGFYCETCSVTLKDNLSFLDHLNSKQHLVLIGKSLLVERSFFVSFLGQLWNR